MRDIVYILAGMAFLALLGMGAAKADLKHDLQARIVMLKDRVIFQQMQRCPSQPKAGECSHDATVIIQALDTVQAENEEMGFGPYGSEDPGVRAYLDHQFGLQMQAFEEFRRKYPSQ
ncbi:hypothetical protein JNK62_03510 [bacterium]|nr:hypothetical protein [bacterium]